MLESLCRGLPIWKLFIAAVGERRTGMNLSRETLVAREYDLLLIGPVLKAVLFLVAEDGPLDRRSLLAPCPGKASIPAAGLCDSSKLDELSLKSTSGDRLTMGYGCGDSTTPLERL